MAKIFLNKKLTGTFTKQGCGDGWKGSEVTYTVREGRYYSWESQNDADQKAQNDISLNGQNYANQNGECLSHVFYNKEVYKEFCKNDCLYGAKGSTVPYIVKRGRYISYVSQHDADTRAEQEATQHGQAYANTHGLCEELYASRYMEGCFYRNNCPNGTGQEEPVLFTLEQGHITSKSSQEDADSRALVIFNKLGQAKANTEGICSPIYYSKAMYDYYRKIDCGKGYIGGRTIFRVEAGYAYSYRSQEDADDIARKYMIREGILNANANGECEVYNVGVTANVYPKNGGAVENLGEYQEGSIFHLMITPAEGYVVDIIDVNGVRIQYDPVSGYYFELNIDTVIDVWMKAEKTVEITAVPSPIGGGTVSGAGTYKLGQTCPLIATANNGYAFDGWYRNGMQVSIYRAYNLYVENDSGGEYVARFKRIRDVQ